MSELMQDEDLKRQLIDYLVDNDGQDSIEMLVEGVLRIVQGQAQESLARLGTCSAKYGDSLHINSPDCVRWQPAAPLGREGRRVKW